jgi:hypothetical protein
MTFLIPNLILCPFSFTTICNSRFSFTSFSPFPAFWDYFNGNRKLPLGRNIFFLEGDDALDNGLLRRQYLFLVRL